MTSVINCMILEEHLRSKSFEYVVGYAENYNMDFQLKDYC